MNREDIDIEEHFPWIKEGREKADRETAGMTLEQKKEYYRQKEKEFIASTDRITEHYESLTKEEFIQELGEDDAEALLRFVPLRFRESKPAEPAAAK
jgi:hypothetical protein